MNITPRLLPNLRADKADREPTEEERREQRRQDRLERKRLGLDLGPRRLRTATNGQIRRAQVRRAATERRKAALRHRRTFMHNRFLEARLVGMVRQAEQDTPLGRNARQGLLYAFKGQPDEQGNPVETWEQALDYAKDIADPILARRALQGLAK